MFSSEEAIRFSMYNRQEYTNHDVTQRNSICIVRLQYIRHDSYYLTDLRFNFSSAFNRKCLQMVIDHQSVRNIIWVIYGQTLGLNNITFNTVIRNTGNCIILGVQLLGNISGYHYSHQTKKRTEQQLNLICRYSKIKDIKLIQLIQSEFIF